MTARGLALAQFVCDIVGSKDGSIAGERRGPNDPQVVSVFTTNPDLQYTADYHSPRLGPKILNIMLEGTFKDVTGIDLEIETYGKPYKFNYQFAEQHLRKYAEKRAIKISNMYMIGDNPKSDIAGAIAMGWTSILVKTGCFNPNDPSSENGNDR